MEISYHYANVFQQGRFLLIITADYTQAGYFVVQLNALDLIHPFGGYYIFVLQIKKIELSMITWLICSLL